jgi:hypothetical protein
MLHSTKDSHQNQNFYVRTKPKFQYRSLNPERNEIRLLRIKPVPHLTKVVECEIFHTPLETAPPYQALSYSWGDRASLEPLLVDSQIISVTPNLQQALQRLRPREGEQELVIWVDAVCINQSDIPERNVQTGKMRMIYQNAEMVSVWLGLEHHGSQVAIQLARDLNGCPSDTVPSLLHDPANAGALEALVLLFRRQYWWRIWVIQEVSCAKNSIVYCGSESISWAELENVCNILLMHVSHLQEIYYKNLSYIRTLTHGGPKGLLLSRYSPSLSAPPLLELLLSHKSKKSTDPKDKVYALVGISSSRNTFGNIDYSRSEREIFTHTARHIISSSRKLDVICVKQHDVRQYGLPSWAPDWTRPGPGSGQTIIGLQHHEPSFFAAGDSLADVEFEGDGYVLRAKGFVLDNISAVGMTFWKRGPPSDVLAALQAFAEWRQLFLSSHSDTPSSRAVFARSISCGNWIFNDPKFYEEKLDLISRLARKNLVRYSTDARKRRFGELKGDGGELERVETTAEEKAMMAAILSASLSMNRRAFFVSEGNYVGLGPWDMEKEDVICVLLGCRFPVVLRRVEGGYVLIGEAYVDGFMDGEAMEGLRNGEFGIASFKIY